MTEPPRDLSHWDLIDPLSLKQAAVLWTDEDPSEPETIRYKVIGAALQRAVQDGSLPGAAVKEVAFIGDDPNPAFSLDWDRTMIKRADLARWARVKGKAPGFLAADLKDLGQVPTPPEPGSPNGEQQGTQVPAGAAPVKRARSRSKNELLTPEDVAEMLAVKVDTLAKWRSVNRYPELAPVKIGRSVRYKEANVLAFMEGGKRS